MGKSTLNGVYLVVDPSMDQTMLLEKIEEALQGGVDILQIWNHWPEGISKPDKKQLIAYIKEMASEYEVPVLINEEWQLLKMTELDGVHFDSVPEKLDKIKEEINRDFIVGITCSNNLDIVRWAEENDLDYISFCAMFPSPSVESCPIIQPETVQKAQKITDMPLFLSGGITPEKISEFEELDFNGVAVISGILKEDAPRKRVNEYKRALIE